MGRTSKLTPDRQEKICQLIAAGNYLAVAAQATGITDRTLYRWMAVGGKAKSGIYFHFFQAVKIAEAEAESHYLGIIKNAAQSGTWTAAAWYLERRYPDKWGRKDRLDLYDWRPDMIELIRAGKIKHEEIVEQLGNATATELFAAAGVAVSGG